MPRQRARSGEQIIDTEPDRDHEPDHNPGYDLTALYHPIPKLSHELSKPVDFKFKCGDYEWNVHQEPIVQNSKVFDMMTNMHFKEGQDRTIDLPEDEPELIARMIQFCYFEEYSLSLYTYLKNAPHAKPIEVVQRQSFTGPQKDFTLPSEPACDALLHFKMFNIADKYDIPRLETYALKKVKKFLGSEQSAVWACVQYLQQMSDMAIDKVEPLLVSAATGGYWGTNLDTVLWPASEEFVLLKDLRPKMAQEIEKIVQNRFPENKQAYRKTERNDEGEAMARISAEEL